MARVCLACGHENADGDDFCGSCGTFMRWDPTQTVPAVPGPAGQPVVPAPPPPAPAEQGGEPALPPGDDGTPCPACGTTIPHDRHFCPNCGTYITRSMPALAAAPAAAAALEPIVEPEPVADEPDAAAPEPDPIHVEREPGPAPSVPAEAATAPRAWWTPAPSAPDATPVPVAAEPEPAAPEPDPVAVEPEPVEPAPVAVEPEPEPTAHEAAPEQEEHQHADGTPCPVCGANVPLDRYFCPNCGAYATRAMAAVAGGVPTHAPEAPAPAPPVVEPEPLAADLPPAPEPTPPAPEPEPAPPPAEPPPPARPPIRTDPPDGIQLIAGELRPAIAKGQLHGRLALMVRSSADDTILVDVRAADARGVCTFEIEQPSFPASPGRRAGTAMTVRAPARLFGRTIDHHLEIVAAPRVPGAREERFEAIFRQRPKVPLWGAAVLILPVLAAIFLLTRNGGGGSTGKTVALPRVDVPDLRGTASLATAESRLLRLGLRLGAVRHRRQSGPRPGSVIDESPPAGSTVAPGTAVTVVLAVGRAGRVVPTIVGLTVDKAVALLRTSGLQLGEVTTRGSAGTAIARQEPPAGTRVPRGSAVAVTLSPPRAAPVTQTTTVTTTTPGTTTAIVPPVEPVAVPALTGLRLGDAINTLGGAGLTPREERRISADVPTGSLIGQLPAAGTKLKPGSAVTLLVSAGMPDIAYDKDGHVFIAGGRTGTPVHTTARGGKQDEQPAWNPAGTLIAFRRGDDETGQIWVVRAGKPKTAHALTATGFDDRRPAFSPDGKVIAFVRATSRTARHDLCFLRLAEPKEASCVKNAKLDVSRPAWSPDGSLIAVVAGPAVRGPTAEPVELELLRSGRRSSPNASTWKSLGLATSKLHGKRPTDAVWSAAFRPDGKRLAISANWGADFFHLFLVPISGTHLGKALSLPRIQGCELAWRPDGLELALVQRDATCTQFGTIVRVQIAHPDSPSVLTKLGAENPAWDPALPAS